MLITFSDAEINLTITFLFAITGFVLLFALCMFEQKFVFL